MKIDTYVKQLYDAVNVYRGVHEGSWTGDSGTHMGTLCQKVLDALGSDSTLHSNITKLNEAITIAATIDEYVSSRQNALINRNGYDKSSHKYAYWNGEYNKYDALITAEMEQLKGKLGNGG